MTDDREDRVRRVSRGAPSPHVVLGDHLAYVKSSHILGLGDDAEPCQDLARPEPVEDDANGSPARGPVGGVDVEGHVDAVDTLGGDLQRLAIVWWTPRRRIE